MTTVTPTAIAPPSDTPTEAAPSPRTITYRVTGNRQLLDLVTVIYTDAQGALQTDVNVALPWSWCWTRESSSVRSPRRA
jgi:hypothetical protein